MAWSAALDDNFSLFSDPVLELEDDQGWNYTSHDNSLCGNQCDFSSAFDATEETLAALLGSPLIPFSSISDNVNGFDDLDCSSVAALTRIEGLEASPISSQLQKVAGAKCGLDKSHGAKCVDDGKKKLSRNGGEANNSGECAGMPISINKGKKNGKNGLPAKNLMSERRRRKKLNDRLYMLRSVVPKISKGDKASILGDAIGYLKELLDQINELHNELRQSSENASCLGLSKFPFMKHMPNPDTESPKVEVRIREDKGLNIHMFCSGKPGLLLSIMKILDGLGLDVKQAVISCFNGFTLHVFQAEQSMGEDIPANDIKALLLHTAGYQTTSEQIQLTTS